jgi:ferric-dicitrate binding protein FerR (iron transport regulator)
MNHLTHPIDRRPAPRRRPARALGALPLALLAVAVLLLWLAPQAARADLGTGFTGLGWAQKV